MEYITKADLEGEHGDGDGGLDLRSSTRASSSGLRGEGYFGNVNSQQRRECNVALTKFVWKVASVGIPQVGLFGG